MRKEPESTDAVSTSVQISALNVALMKQHPVITNQAHLPTPPIKRIYSILDNAIVEHDSGCCFVAFSRFGKTFAIRVLKAQLKYNFQDVPILSVNAKGHDTFSETTFFSELSDSLAGGAGVSKGMPGHSRKANILRRHVLRFIWTAAESKDGDKVVLFVDEAQNWHEKELSALRDLSNDLLMDGNVDLISVFFGAPALISIRESLLDADRTDLIGRFMLKQFEFQGICTLAELMDVNKCYDDVTMSEFPIGSGVSYSAFFFPMAFKHGWRLEKEASLAWGAFMSIASPHGGFNEIGMKWIASAIRRFFTEQSGFDTPQFRGTAEMWMQAVKSSGFAQTLGVTYSKKDS